MSKHIVILVHGMGTHKKGEMSKQFCEGVNETAKLFSIKNFDIENSVTLVEFNYSDYFDKIRKKLSENADNIVNNGFESLIGNGIEEELMNKLLGFESSFSDDSNFFNTHWLDVILYATHFGGKIRVDFAKLLNEQLYKHRGDKQIHIICHSLGTAVVHDTLSKLYRKDTDITDEVPDLIPGTFSVNSLWTFANVSQMVNLLNGNIIEDPMYSHVKTGEDGCTYRFINVKHQLDPFTWIKPYKRKMNRLTTFINETVRRWNTHDFKEYISDPKVTKQILDAFTREEKQHNKDINLVMKKYQENTINEAREQLLQVKKTFKDKKIVSFKDSVKAINSIINSVDKLKKDFQNEN